MRLDETKFRVLYNDEFISLLQIDIEQIAWMVRESARLMTTDKWATNTVAYRTGEDLDCWQHDLMLRSGQQIVIEGVPYPDQCLMLWTPQYPRTMPRSGYNNTHSLNYPEDFVQWLDKDRKQLGVFKEGEGFSYGDS